MAKRIGRNGKNNDIKHITQKTKDRTTRTSLKPKLNLDAPDG